MDRRLLLVVDNQNQNLYVFVFVFACANVDCILIDKRLVLLVKLLKFAHFHSFACFCFVHCLLKTF